MLNAVRRTMQLRRPLERIVSRFNNRAFRQSQSTISIIPPKVKRCDIVIVGGGPVGSAVAYHCAKRSLGRVVVLESDKTLNSSSAVLSAGGIRQQFSVPENVRMSMYGAEFIKNIKDLAIDGDESPDVQLREFGYLFLAGNEEAAEVLRRNNETQRSCGVDWVELLQPQRLREMFPWLNSESLQLGSLSRMNEGFFDPWAFINVMKKKAESLGVEYLEGTVVGANLIEGAYSSSTKIESLEVSEKQSSVFRRVAGGVFVNATGAWAGELVKMIASKASRPKAIFPVPVEPRKRCLFTIHCPTTTDPENGVYAPPPEVPLVVDPTGVYFRPDGKPGRFLAGVSPSAQEEDPAYLHATALEQVDHRLFEEKIWPVLAERVPVFEQIKVQSSWAGFYDYNTLDQNAIIGRHSELSNMILCNGFSGHGLQHSPAAGRAVSELIATGSDKFETIDLRRFSFDRVVARKPIHETGIV